MRSAASVPLSQYRFSSPVRCQFGFTEAKKEEMRALIQRYGTTTTGIGRIMIQMGRNRIWRELLESSGVNWFQSIADRPIETEQPQLEAM
jgi:hypothetical protein